MLEKVFREDWGRVLASLVRARLTPKLWRGLHMLSYVLLGLVFVICMALAVIAIITRCRPSFSDVRMRRVAS